MSEPQHTPGPWVFSENAYGAVFVHGGETLTSSVGTEYKELVAGGNSHNTLTLANARLIAAAPDLLALAKQYEAWEADVILHADWAGETPRLTQEQFDMLISLQARRNDAIAKAEGRA